MRAAWWFGLLVVPLLAGCLGDEGSSKAPTSSAPATFAVTAGIPVAEPPAMTSTLRFREGHVLTTLEPDAYEPVRIPIYTAYDVATGGTRLTVWNFTWPADVSAIRGEVELSVDVHGLVLNSPYATSSGGEACFWGLYVEVYDPTATVVERDGQNAAPCVDEPQVVPEGPRTLRIPFELPGTSFASGYTALVGVSAQAYAYSNDARIELLTGSIKHDSSITFEGVGWPVGLDPVTLLTTTTG